MTNDACNNDLATLINLPESDQLNTLGVMAEYSDTDFTPCQKLHFALAELELILDDSESNDGEVIG